MAPIRFVHLLEGHRDIFLRLKNVFSNLSEICVFESFLTVAYAAHGRIRPVCVCVVGLQGVVWEIPVCMLAKAYEGGLARTQGVLR